MKPLIQTHRKNHYKAETGEGSDAATFYASSDLDVMMRDAGIKPFTQKEVEAIAESTLPLAIKLSNTANA